MKGDYKGFARQLVGLYSIKPRAFLAVHSACYSDLTSEFSSWNTCFLFGKPGVWFSASRSAILKNKKGKGFLFHAMKAYRGSSKSHSDISRNFFRFFQGNTDIAQQHRLLFLCSTPFPCHNSQNPRFSPQNIQSWFTICFRLKTFPNTGRRGV